MNTYQIYNDIRERTGGEIYIGVVGPVRSGKSTFIKRFMDMLVIPGIVDVHDKERAIDELPQSAEGKTIMTTEPKFIPNEAVLIPLVEGVSAKVKMIDCVGYMVDGAQGHLEGESDRMVQTPWFPEKIPFTKAAEIGTRKVIHDHSTIGIVITCDGSFGDLPREAYVQPEKKTIDELKSLGKPFIAILNSQRPYDESTKQLAMQLSDEYGICVIPVNVEQLKSEDVNRIMENMLSSFPISQLNFYIPKWAEMLPSSHWLKSEIISKISEISSGMQKMEDVRDKDFDVESNCIKNVHVTDLSMDDGKVSFQVGLDDKFYYEILSDLTGTNIKGEYQLVALMKELVAKRDEIEKISEACDSVKAKGYGVVIPSIDEIQIRQPEVIKHGNKFGVKIKAMSPSVHLIQANIETEIAPIVGSEEQANDLIQYITQNTKDNPDGIWDTSIFGKSIRQLVEDGIDNKVNRLSDESQVKLQETIQKVVNDSNGGLVCIII